MGLQVGFWETPVLTLNPKPQNLNPMSPESVVVNIQEFHALNSTQRREVGVEGFDLSFAQMFLRLLSKV